MAHPTRTKEPALCDALSALSADGYRDATDCNKRVAARVGVHPSNHSRWRTHGIGPVRECVEYLRASDRPLRIAATILSAARMIALGSKSTDELIALYWTLRSTEVDREARDASLAAANPHEWSWQDHAKAAESDASVDLTIAAVERIFAARNVSPAEVLGGRARA